MKRASISEVEKGLSSYIDRVREGEVVVITDRARPVAQLVPAAPSRNTDLDERKATLESRGALLRAAARAGQGFLDHLPPLPKANGDVVDALLDERREGR